MRPSDHAWRSLSVDNIGPELRKHERHRDRVRVARSRGCFCSCGAGRAQLSLGIPLFGAGCHRTQTHSETRCVSRTSLKVTSGTSPASLGRRRVSPLSGFENLAHPKHEPSYLHSTQHAAIEHPAIAAKHFPLAYSGAMPEGRPHPIGELRIMCHVIPLRPMVGAVRARPDMPVRSVAIRSQTAEP